MNLEGGYCIKPIFPLIKFLLLVITWNVHAQADIEPLIINYDHQDYNLNPLDYEEGYHNWSVAVDSTGIAYIGNNNGLLEFDGSDWQLHRIADAKKIRSVAFIDGRVYTGAYKEFGYWIRNIQGQLGYISLSDSMDQTAFHNDEIWRIVAHGGKIYFQSFSSLFVYDGKKMEIIKPDFIMVLLQKANERLFVHGVNRGLFEVVDGEFRFIEGSEVLSEDEIKVVLPVSEGQLLLGAAFSGLHLYDGTTVKEWKVPVNDLIKDARINNGLKLGDQFVIGTTVDGIYIFSEEGKMERRLNIGNGLQSNTILSLFKEKGQQFWAATDVGLEFIRLDSELSIYRGPKFKIGKVFSGSRNVSGDGLLVGTNRGLFEYIYSSVEGYKGPHLVPGTQGQVWGLHNYNDQVLTGHNDGTFLIQENNTLHWLSYINGGSFMKKIISDNQEYLIQSTYTVLVVYKFNGGRWTFSHTVAGVFEPISHFEIDSQENLWAVHKIKGLFKIKLNSNLDSAMDIKFYENILDKGRNLSVSKIDDRIIFTTDSLIFTYDRDRDEIVPYTELNNTLGENKKAERIVHIRNDQYWFVMDNRIVWIQLDNENAKIRFEYDLSNMEFFVNSNLPSVITKWGNRHFIGLNEGFVIFDEVNLDKPVDDHPVYLRRITVNGKKGDYNLPLKTDEPVQISYKDRNLVFHYSSTERSLVPKYRYKLEGISNQWSEWTHKASVEFTKLPAGEYTLNVQARNTRSRQSAILSYSFTVNSPWYATNIAIVLYVIIVIIVIIGIRQISVIRVRRQTELLESMVSQRTRELKEVNNELESFSYSVSHDLRAPLRALEGFSRALTDKYGDQMDEEGKRWLRFIRENSLRMDALIKDILEFSRVSRHQVNITEFNMTELIREVFREQNQAFKDRKIDFDLEELPNAFGDRLTLKQVWTNLISNALKFSSKEEVSKIQIRGETINQVCRYSVEDNGAGFKMKYADKVFGIFQRLHKQSDFEGTGVGMAIVKRIIEKHHGTIWVESKEGKGTIFYFELPLKPLAFANNG